MNCMWHIPSQKFSGYKKSTEQSEQIFSDCQRHMFKEKAVGEKFKNPDYISSQIRPSETRFSILKLERECSNFDTNWTQWKLFEMRTFS